MYNRKLVFGAACLGMLLFGIVMISLGTINTFLTAKFQLDPQTVGSLAALLPFGILAGSLIFGPICDRYGYKGLLIISAILILIGVEMTVMAKSFSVLRYAFLLIGFGGGIINGGTNAVVADISAEEKGAKLSLLGVFFGIGALGMPVLVGVLGKYFSTERIVMCIGLLIVVPIVFFSLVRFPEPKHKQGFPLKQGLGLLKNGTLILIGVILFFESGMEGMVSNWSTTYLESRLFLTPKEALYALSFVMLGMTVARIFLGYLLTKVRDYIILLVCIVIIICAGLILKFAGSFQVAIVGLSLFGVGFSPAFPVLYGYAGNLYAQYSGTAFSIILTIALLGNTALNYSVGVISKNYGIEHYLTVILISAVIMLILVGLITKRTLSKLKI
ncbi:MAG: MFS transporter [Candidatus Neomarinimicrobiota bacterium]